MCIWCLGVGYDLYCSLNSMLDCDALCGGLYMWRGGLCKSRHVEIKLHGCVSCVNVCVWCLGVGYYYLYWFKCCDGCDALCG